MCVILRVLQQRDNVIVLRHTLDLELTASSKGLVQGIMHGH